MERLTNKSWRNFDPWECCGQDQYCQRGCHDPGGCTKGCIVPRLYKRLAAYEDTGLTPQDVISMHGEWRAMMSVLNSIGGGYTRLRELAEADKDGRLVILPCKVGDTVWITGSVRRLYSEKVRTFFCGDPSYSRGMADNGVKMIRTTGCDIPIHEFGKTVFLTCEEAEKVLEAMKDG